MRSHIAHISNGHGKQRNRDDFHIQHEKRKLFTTQKRRLRRRKRIKNILPKFRFHFTAPAHFRTKEKWINYHITNREIPSQAQPNEWTNRKKYKWNGIALFLSPFPIFISASFSIVSAVEKEAKSGDERTKEMKYTPSILHVWHFVTFFVAVFWSRDLRLHCVPHAFPSRRISFSRHGDAV